MSTQTAMGFLIAGIIIIAAAAAYLFWRTPDATVPLEQPAAAAQSGAAVLVPNSR